MYGSLLNVDSGRTESFHKKKKNIGRHTQRRVHSFENQTAEKEYLYDTFVAAMVQIGITPPTSFESHDIEEDQANNTAMTNSSAIDLDKKLGSRFVLVFDYSTKKVNAMWVSRGKVTEKPAPFADYVLEMVWKKYSYYNHGNIGQRIVSIPCFTEYYVKNNSTDVNDDSVVIFRACPRYRNEKHWFDWAVINWGEGFGLLEGQILMFLDFSDFSKVEFESYDDYEAITGMDIEHARISDGKTAIIHSTKAGSGRDQHQRKFTDSNTRGRPRGNNNANGIKLVNRLCCFKEMEDAYQFVTIDTINAPCTVIVDTSREGYKSYDSGQAKQVIVVSPLKRWHLKFIDYESDENMTEGSRRKDVAFPPDHERFTFEG